MIVANRQSPPKSSFQLRRVIRTLPYTIYSIQWTSDGEVLAVGNDFGVIRLWDAKTAKYVSWFEAHREPVNSLTWSPDGRTLASASEGGIIRLWDVNKSDGKTRLKTELPLIKAKSVRQLSWSPTGKTISAELEDGTINLWDTENGRWKRTLTGNTDFPSQATWSPDGILLAFGSLRGEIHIWKEGVDAVARIIEDSSTYYLGPSWLPDGKGLAAGTLDGSICIWSSWRSDWDDIYKVSESYITNVACSPNGTMVAAESNDGLIWLWDRESERVLGNVNEHVDKSANLCWSPDGKLLTFGDKEGRVHFWNAKKLKAGIPLPCESALDTRIALSGDGYSRFRSVAWSSDGNALAVNLNGEQISILNTETGTSTATIDVAKDFISDISWSPTSRTLAVASEAQGIYLWNDKTPQIEQIIATQGGYPLSISWSQDGSKLAAGTHNGMVLLWDVAETVQLWKTFFGEDGVNLISWSPDGKQVVFAVQEDGVYIWNPAAKGTPRKLHNNRKGISALTWSPNGTMLSFGDTAGTVFICNLQDKTKLRMRTLSGHREQIASLVWSPDGALLASASDDRVLLWLTESWDVVEVLGKVPAGQSTESISFHRRGKIAATFNFNTIEIHARLINPRQLFERQKAPTAISYTSAKIVLVGDSNVGKSCLGLRLAQNRYEEQGTTHGMRTWQLSPDQIHTGFVIPPGEKLDITLWDMGGQDEYRLIHQLFLHDTTVAMVLFDATRGRTTFAEVEEWSLRLEKQLEGRKATKFLVGAKLDKETDLIDRAEVQRLIRKYGFTGFYETSAKTKRGIRELGEALVQAIDWSELSQTTRLTLFQRIWDKIEEKSRTGQVVMLYVDLEGEVGAEEDDYDPDAMNAVVRQLSLQGVIVDTRLVSGERALVFQVGEVERYAGALIVEARNNPRGIPALEAQSLATIRSFPGIKKADRLPPLQERIVVECVFQLLIERNVCLVHEGLLIFPSLFKIAEQEQPEDTSPAASLFYDFSGAIDNIYTTLIVRLALSGGFGRVRMRKDGAEFERPGLGICEIRNVARGGGLAHLDLLFSSDVAEETRGLFTLFVEDHLRKEGVTITEHLVLTCIDCSKFKFDEWILRERLKEGQRNVTCPLCETKNPIIEGAASQRENNPELVRRLIALKTDTNINTRRAVVEMRNTLEESTQDFISGRQDEQSSINILHLSDIHIGSEDDPFRMLQPLARDLEDKKDGLGLDRIDYLVISGDLTNRATAGEFDKAYEFISELNKRFQLTPHRCIIVPGNHDQSWDINNLFRWKKQREVSEDDLVLGTFAKLGRDYAIRDEKAYPRRFENFSKFYHSLVQQEYPLKPEDQFLSFLFDDTRIQFLTMNSSWEIDEYFQDRASINDSAISRGLLRADEQVKEAKESGRIPKAARILRIGVWHHPITGNEKIKQDSFLERLQVADVKLCLHGHIHEEKSDLLYHLHPGRNIHIAGAGTFGAIAKDRPSSTPRLYSLVKINKDHRSIQVHNRGRRRDDGKWAAWNIWPSSNKGEGRSYYDIKLR